ncbi:hypothetical protein [Streptomyces prasinus]
MPMPMPMSVVAPTRDGIEDTAIRDGVHDVEDVRTAEYRAARASTGLTP